MVAVVSAVGSSRAQAQQPKPEDKTVDLKVTNPIDRIVMIELYQDGKLIRTREIAAAFVSHGTTTFNKLKPGRYEVHFLAPSYKPFVKRMLLSEEDTEQTITVQLNVDGGVIGGGVSLQELAEQIAQLKKENAELRAEIEKLKKK
jgi:hypothetical protein